MMPRMGPESMTPMSALVLREAVPTRGVRLCELVDDVGRQWRCGGLDGLCVELGRIFEYSFAISQYHRDDVENEFIEAAGLQRLADGARPTGDVDWAVAGMLDGFGKRRFRSEER